MLKTRVMPCLLLNAKGLVKTIRFKNPQYIGDPINAVRIYNQKEVDELILLDIEATSKKRPIQFDLIEQIASECFMPLCYGGGISSIADMRRLFYSGVEKISLSSLLFRNPELVQEAVSIFGSQSIIGTLDIKRSFFWGKYKIYTHSGKVNTRFLLDNAVTYVSRLGIGELILNSIDRDGTWTGYDSVMIRAVADVVDIPVVALGGCGHLNHIVQAVREAHASAVALGSMSVFQARNMGVLIKFPKPSEIEALHLD